MRQAKCLACDGHGLVGRMTAEGGETYTCDDCGGRGTVSVAIRRPIDAAALREFYDTIPESVAPHLTESEVAEEYRHHYECNPDGS